MNVQLSSVHIVSHPYRFANSFSPPSTLKRANLDFEAFRQITIVFSCLALFTIISFQVNIKIDLIKLHFLISIFFDNGYIEIVMTDFVNFYVKSDISRSLKTDGCNSF